jgi:hypothetical protein
VIPALSKEGEEDSAGSSAWTASVKGFAGVDTENGVRPRSASRSTLRCVKYDKRGSIESEEEDTEEDDDAEGRVA